MDDTSRAVGRTIVELTDVFVGGADLPAGARRGAVLCAELLGVQAAGILTCDEQGEPVPLGASEERAELLAQFEVACEQGPGVDAVRTGERVECVDLSAAGLRWPRFAPAAVEAGVAAAYGLPCRLRDQTVGALTLYLTSTGALSADTVELGRGLANTVSLGVTAHRGHELRIRAEQLQGALQTRVVIEQAKGALAERSNISVDEAFKVMRGYARNTGSKIRDVCQDVLSGKLTFPAPSLR
jgi:hypothetical protein